MKRISVYMQPVSEFRNWKAYGVNSLFGCPVSEDGKLSADGLTFTQWCDAADAMGLTYRLPFNLYAFSLYARTGCIGVIQSPQEPNGAGGISGVQCASQTAAIRKLTGKPVSIVLDFAATRWQTDVAIAQYLATADEIAGDLYPLARGEGPGAIVDIGKQVARCARLAPGKPIVSFIDTSDQQLNLSDWLKGTPQGAAARAPTAAEMKLEIDTAVKAGATEISFFPQVLGAGWVKHNGTTPEISAALPGVIASLVAPVANATTFPLEGKAVTIDGYDYRLRRS